MQGIDIEAINNTMRFLCTELTRVEAQTGGIRQLVEHGMASRLLALAFGYEWYADRIKFRSDNTDEWMFNGDDKWLAANPIENDVRRIVHTHRTIRLGDAVFTLLSGGVKGIDEMKNRFLSRPTKPCFIEAEIASMLVYNGFQVEIIKESGKRGEDFDLFVIKDGAAVSVEVTSKIDGPLTVRTIKNTLHDKRSQVRDDCPAVLYMHIPAKWMRHEATSSAVLTEAIIEFIKRSKRFNIIVFVWEEVIPFMTGGFPTLSMRACFNEMPRHRFEPRHLFEPQQRPDQRSTMAYNFLERLEVLRARFQTGN